MAMSDRADEDWPEPEVADSRPVWVLVDENDAVVASVRADTGVEARDQFKRAGQQGVRIRRAEVAPVEAKPGLVCAFCGNHGIDPEQDFQHVTAWRKKRHGTNSPNYVKMYEPHPDGKWACRFCIDRLSNGVSPFQQALM